MRRRRGVGVHHRPTRSATLRRAAAALVVVLILCSTAELALRLFWHPASFLPYRGARMMLDEPLLGWCMKPGTHVERGIEYRVNSLGLRGGPFSVEKPAGVRRVLCVGESSTWGQYTREDDAYPQVLQRLLQGHGSWEVLNAGVPGYSIWQSRVFLEARGLALQPDLVLIYNEANDHMPRGLTATDGSVFGVHPSDRGLYRLRRPVAPLLALLYRCRIYLGLRSLLLRPPDMSARDPSMDPSLEATPAARVSEDDRRRAVIEMDRIARAHGARLVVVQPLYRESVAHTATLSLVTAEAGLLYVDLPHAREQAGRAADPGLMRDDVHPTEAGHAFIGHSLFEALEGAGYLGP